MMRSPIASPIHQTSQREPTADQGCTPPRQRLVTPMVALTIVLSTAARTTRPTTSRRRSSEPWQPTRRSSQAPITASRVFPMAMPPAVQSGSLAVALARNAPARMPGQTRYPSTSAAASAMPVGGHTAVTCSATVANERPSLAAAK